MKKKYLTLLCFATLVLAAFNFLALPKTIYDIGLDYQWSGIQKANVLSAGVFGFVFAALIGGYLSEIFGKKQIMVFGLLLSFLGNAVFGYIPQIGLTNPFYLFVLFGLLTSSGSGILEGLANALIIHLHPHKSSFYLNVGQAFFAFGAIVAPALGGYLIVVSNWQLVFYLNSAVSLILVVGFLLRTCPRFRTEQRLQFVTLFRLSTDKVFVLLNLCAVLYVAAEVGLLAWLGEYVRVNADLRLSQFQSGMFLSYFWLAMLIGRIVRSWWIKKTSPTLVLVLSGLGGITVITLFLATSNAFLAGLLIFVCGAFLSAIFPTILAVAGERFPQYLGILNGSLIASVGLGGIVAPNMIGRLSDIPGIGLSGALATCVLYLLGVVLIALRLPRNSANSIKT